MGEVLSQRMLVLDGLSGRFRSFKLRGRSPECITCGAEPSITAANLAAFNYGAFTGQAADDRCMTGYVSLI